jgi:hypothetical protein
MERTEGVFDTGTFSLLNLTAYTAAPTKKKKKRNRKRKKERKAIYPWCPVEIVNK